MYYDEGYNEHENNYPQIKILGGFMIQKRILVILLMVILVPALVFSADKPKVKKGAEILSVSGVTRNWKDTKKISAEEMFSSRKMKPVMNFKNPKKLIKVSTKKDPVVQEGGLEQAPLAMSSTIIDFAGMNLNSNGAGWPPDTNGDVGSTYFVQTVNTSIGIYNKSTGALVSATTFDSFFGGSAPCTADNNGDPIVLYDQYAQRWFILDFAWSGTNNGSYYSVAVSKTSDPTGAWWQYCLQADATLMNDYPKCGVWHDGIYTTANMFSFTTSQFQHAKVWAFKKPDIYNGVLTVQSLTDSSAQAWSILPTNAKGTTAPTGPNYMYAVDADEYGGSSIDAIYCWKMTVDWNNSNNTTWVGPSTMNVAAYGLTANRIPQSGTSTQLDSLYGRLMYPANYRNFGSYGAVYVCHVAEYNSTRQMRWYEIRINGGTCSIYQQGTFAPDSTHRWMGAIAGDKNGSIAMGYSASSSSIVPAIRYAGRLSTDPLGQLSQGEATMIQGTGYQTSYTRWGDYSSMTIDPDDDETFWYTTEYYASNGTNWQTRIGSFKMAPPVPDTTPPVISNVGSSNVAATTANINWDTDEAATSVVHYGLTTSYGSTQTVSGYDTAHSVGLSGLTALTTYHYKVVSVDASSNSSESGDFTFTTTDVVAEITLSGNGYKSKGQKNADLTWSGAVGSSVKIYRDGVLLVTTTNDGAYTDNIGRSRINSYVYTVCETDDSVCSNDATVTF
jgi:Purple acid Phosphatase, N-terminal domain